MTAAEPLYQRHWIHVDEYRRMGATGIPEVWLVDLNGGSLWVYRQPGPDGYREALHAQDLAAMTPLALPDAACDLSGLV